MVDEIQFIQTRSKVNELSRYPVTVKFKDSDGDAATPTNAYYRLDCLTTKTELVPWTTLGVAASSMSVTLTPTNNTVQCDDNQLESKQLTIAADYGLSTQFLATLNYQLVNLEVVE